MNAKPANAFVSVESRAGLHGKGASVFGMFSTAYARERREVLISSSPAPKLHKKLAGGPRRCACRNSG